ncbi:extracellular calcium-sensing receptor-like [Stylophora pistillata]|nr:extracellular calcium-sensing receptor-like [Stylophora pistillata]XP_022781881.1 extracellular calcium-sensing receptor-like [Stylophora pistillata]XP_022781882.1 extracellular calcium-sensing receptor-like [Stylophora pistillata]XP_022781883.1 extracellular calcium-sensing receptor-like [Stylophora pistillata]XP_022781884.1 extracellular calcium-sensing receptor-like [Stylophora pistillata]XP_022781885.1 extracellular calcium-sensing receptor-like [Stylophora pistillata]
MAMPSSFLMFIFLAAVLSCFVKAGAKTFPRRTAYEDGTIMLGGLFDLHHNAGENNSCGNLLAANLGSVQAMIFAIERINDNKRFLPNVTIGYEILDYCLQPAIAVETSYELVVKSDHRFSLQNCTGKNAGKEIAGVIGPMDSASAIMVSSLFEIAHIPSISSLATSVELSSTLYNHFYRTVSPDSWRASLLADIAQFFNWTYVAAIALDDSFGRYGVWGIEKESNSRENLCIALTRFVPRVDPFDQVEKIVLELKKMENVKVVLVWLYGRYAQSFMNEVVRQGVKGKTWIFTDGTTPTDPFFEDDRFAGLLNGSFGILHRAARSEEYQKYLVNLAKRNFSGSTYLWWQEYWDNPRDKNISGGSLEEYFSDENPFISSPYVSYTIDGVDAFAHALHNMYNCREPHGLLEGGECPSIQDLKVMGENLNVYLRNVSFQGLTGTVQFDQHGDPLEASYDIVNFKSQIGKGLERVLVGWWTRRSNSKLRLNLTKITWNNQNGFGGIPLSVCSKDCKPGERKVTRSSCCWECVDCPIGTISSDGISSNCSECSEREKPNEERTKCLDLPLNNLKWSDLSAIAVTCTTALGLGLTFLCFAIFIKHRNTPIVKASNKELSFLLLFVVVLFFAFALLNLLSPTDILCRVTCIWRDTVYTLCVSILLLKSMKIVKAFRLQGKLPDSLTSRPKKRKNFCLTGQRLHLLIISSIQVMLNLIWIFVDPPSKETIVRPLQYIFAVCKPFRSVSGHVLLIISVAFLMILSLACIYYAFKGRKIPENFNEARYIGFAMYILLLCSAAYYPVVFGLEGWYVGVIGGVTTLVSSFALLGCMFGPKVYVIIFSPEQNTREAISTEIAKYSLSSTVAGGGAVARVAPVPSSQSSL